MRKSYSNQLRLDGVPIEQVTLNLESRDRIVPVLRALQHVYSDRKLADQILGLIAGDINGRTRTDTGREGMDYWHICVLAAVRLGCNLTHDQLQDFAENHRKLRAIMGLGDCDETEFKWRTIRNNICQLKPETIERISRAIVGEGHQLEPAAIEKVRADSFVMETSIHYPTESSLLYDGLRKIILLCTLLADEHGVSGWRQHAHLLKKAKQLDRKINRIASKKGPNYKTRMKPFYRELLQKTALLMQRARDLCAVVGQPFPQQADLFGANTLQAFIIRTERVTDTARRRVIKGESVPNGDKLFSIFEPHTQLSELVETLCLPKPGAKQSVIQQSEADEEFLAAQQNHSGVESAIGALQSGNALKRCRDRSEVGFERYLQLAILGRNLHTLGRLLIARDNEDAPAGHSRRQAA